MSKELVKAIKTMAEAPMIPDGEEENYDAGYWDGQIVFARALCKEFEIAYEEPK